MFYGSYLFLKKQVQKEIKKNENITKSLNELKNEYKKNNPLIVGLKKEGVKRYNELDSFDQDWVCRLELRRRQEENENDRNRN